MRKIVVDFLESKKDYALIAGFSSGFYALLYLYDKNFTLVNSWSQFVFFIFAFCLVPTILIYVINVVFKKHTFLKRFKKYLIPVFNFMFFAFYSVAVTQGIQKKKILFISIFVAFVLGVLLFKHIKKIIVFQLLLSCFLIVKLIPSLYRAITYSYSWQDQVDEIKDVTFVKTPNVYYLQPDGYVDFETIKKGHYNYDNVEFESFLEANRFEIYNDFRSNYTSTLSSNSSIFSMKHHLYGVKQGHDELYNARTIIAGKNPVIDIFNKNNYNTNLILDVPYLVVNRPNLKYDYCNVNYNDIPYLTRGFSFETNTKKDLFDAVKQNKGINNFYFVRQPKPGHIATTKSQSIGETEERIKYFDGLKVSNSWLIDIISGITERDPNALIIISSDHGGFVGFDYTRQHKVKTQDPDLIASMYSTVLAIKWPNNEIPSYAHDLKSSVNLFRVVFSYLSDNKVYLNHLEDDKSYALIKDGAPNGVYEVIGKDGNIVFNKAAY